ncbi:MAG: MBL fold metallo-hydrolase [Lachnotalea sp.]
MLMDNELSVRRFLGTDYESNCYIVFNKITKKSIIIDPNDFKQLEQFIKKQGLTNEYIFLTHEHYDHVAALSLVKKYIGGIIVSSEMCSQELGNVQTLLNRTYRLHMMFMGNKKTEIPYFQPSKVDKTFQDFLEIKWENSDILLKETIGHSRGSVSIYFTDEMIFSGDAFLSGKPVITKMLGGNKEDYLNSTLAYYESLSKDIKVYPGHGEMFILKDKRVGLIENNK